MASVRSYRIESLGDFLTALSKNSTSSQFRIRKKGDSRELEYLFQALDRSDSRDRLVALRQLHAKVVDSSGLSRTKILRMSWQEFVVLVREHEAGAVSTTNDVAAPCVARYLGDGRIKINDQPPFVLTDREDSVIQALLELGGSASLTQLVHSSGIGDCPRVLRCLRKKYGQVLARYIQMASRKSSGGYRTTITDSRR